MHDLWKRSVNSKNRTASEALFFGFLTFVSWIYGALSYLPQVLVALKLRNRKTYTKKIILIGNITVGGTGKTPFTEELAKRLVKAGKSVLVVEKGYKRKNKKPLLVVSDGSAIYLNAREAGDEPFMIARNVPEAKVVVANDKIRGLEFGLRKFLPEIAIVDDGFQKRHFIEHPVTVVLVDALNPFGHSRIFPAGYLRESENSLIDAETVVITNSNLTTQEQLAIIEEKLLSINRNLKVFTAEHEPKFFYSIKDGERSDLNKFAGKRVILLSGLGNPEGFERTMELMDARICLSLRKPDHHKYIKREIKAVCALLEKTGADAIVTTEKDEVRINKRHIGETPFYALKIGMNVKNMKELEKRLKVSQ